MRVYPFTKDTVRLSNWIISKIVLSARLPATQNETNKHGGEFSLLVCLYWMSTPALWSSLWHSKYERNKSPLMYMWHFVCQSWMLTSFPIFFFFERFKTTVKGRQEKITEIALGKHRAVTNEVTTTAKLYKKVLQWISYSNMDNIFTDITWLFSFLDFERLRLIKFILVHRGVENLWEKSDGKPT